MWSSRFPKDRKISPLRDSWGLCFHFYFLHSSPQALFSFPCLASCFENTTLILIQNISQYPSSWRKKSRSFAVTRRLGVTVSSLAVTGCTPMQSTCLPSFSPLETEVVSDLTGLLKMSLMVLNKLKRSKDLCRLPFCNRTPYSGNRIKGVFRKRSTLRYSGTRH